VRGDWRSVQYWDEDNEYDASYTALHLASKLGLIESVRTLVAVGADPLLVDFKARTCIEVAGLGGYEYINRGGRLRFEWNRVESKHSAEAVRAAIGYRLTRGQLLKLVGGVVVYYADVGTDAVLLAQLVASGDVVWASATAVFMFAPGVVGLYNDCKNKKYGEALLGVLHLRMPLELYNSLSKGAPSGDLRRTKLLETATEGIGQTVLQLYIAFQKGGIGLDARAVSVVVSLLCSTYTLTSELAQRKLPPPAKLATLVYRLAELSARAVSVSLFLHLFDASLAAMVLLLEWALTLLYWRFWRAATSAGDTDDLDCYCCVAYIRHSATLLTKLLLNVGTIVTSTEHALLARDNTLPILGALQPLDLCGLLFIRTCSNVAALVAISTSASLPAEYVPFCTFAWCALAVQLCAAPLLCLFRPKSTATGRGDGTTV